MEREGNRLLQLPLQVKARHATARILVLELPGSERQNCPWFCLTARWHADRLERALLVNVGAFVDLYSWLARDWLGKVPFICVYKSSVSYAPKLIR